MTLERSLLVEIEAAFAAGTSERQAEILRRVTDLFLAGAAQYNDEQADLFDGVILRLAEKIETKARAELAKRLAPDPNAPAATMRRLARDASIEVAGPVLTQSPRLTDDDLLAIAEDSTEDGGQENGQDRGQHEGQDEGQDRLLAISKRAALSENIGDVLVIRGNRDVVLSVSQNEGARFSDAGYRRLVERTIDDEVLAICVGMRKDIPSTHFHTLISKASKLVFERLAAGNPTAVAEVQKVLRGITGQHVVAEPTAIGGGGADNTFDTMLKSGKSADASVQELAESGNFTETIAALSTLAHAPKEFVESVMSDRRGENDFVLLLAKAAGLSWPVAKQICIMRRGPGGLPPLGIEAARRSYASLKSETAQRVIRFYNERHAALDDFQLLAAKIHAQDDAAQSPA